MPPCCFFPVISAVDGEGEEWTPPPKPTGKAAAFFGKPGSGKGMFGWLPAIKESERKTAVLVDSDSDAEYDDDNMQVGGWVIRQQLYISEHLYGNHREW